MPGAEFPGQPDGAGNIDPAGRAERQPLTTDHVVDQRDRFLVRNLVRDIDRRAFEIVGDTRIADSFAD